MAAFGAAWPHMIAVLDPFRSAPVEGFGGGLRLTGPVPVQGFSN
ncbi:MAG TPA: hypothetical protein VFG05_04640 [Methylocella sp.]|nr:hypothetical protein [Methylocella sp.]